MPFAIQVFLIIASILLIGLLISLIMRSIKFFLYIILPLLVIALLIRIGTNITGGIPALPRGTIGIILGIIGAIALVIRLIANTSGILGSIISRIVSICISLLILFVLFNNSIIQNITDRLEHIGSPTSPPSQTGDNNTGYNDPPPTPIIENPCHLPRGQMISDKHYVFAYQNRLDSPSLCDIQIRLCADGDLQGSYTQPFCYPLEDGKVKEIPYDPSQHQDQPNPLIQPGPAPYRNGNFTLRGKRITQTMPPIIIPDITIPPRESSSQSFIMKKYCIAPRGELIKPGQFTKAYELPFGSKHNPCTPELRLCTNGELLGNHLYPSCEVSEFIIH